MFLKYASDVYVCCAVKLFVDVKSFNQRYIKQLLHLK